MDVSNWIALMLLTHSLAFFVGLIWGNFRGYEEGYSQARKLADGAAEEAMAEANKRSWKGAVTVDLAGFLDSSENWPFSPLLHRPQIVENNSADA